MKNQKSSEQNLVNKTIQIFVVVLLASVALSGADAGCLHAQNQSQENEQYQSTVIDPISPNPTIRMQARQRYIDRAKLLRDHWQVWAEQNKLVLRQLVHAEPTDFAALQNAYNAIPADLGSDKSIAGITEADLDAPGARYTWQSYSAGPVEAGSDPGSQMQPNSPDQVPIVKHRLTKGVKADFVQFKDIAICVSINTGRSRYTLWASGRVTETIAMDKYMGRGKPILLYDSDPQQLYPPYDFVQ